MGKRYRKFKRVANTTYQVANKALDTALKVKRLINPELKIIDFAQTATMPNAGDIECLSLIGQGSGSNARNGVSVKYDSLRMNWILYSSTATTTATNQNARIIVFKDSSSNGVMPTITELLNSASVVAQFNNDYKDRFRILHDKCYSLSIAGDRNKCITIELPLGTHGFYSGSNNTIAEVRSANIFVAFIGQNTTTETNYIFESRIWFYDN